MRRRTIYTVIEVILLLVAAVSGAGIIVNLFEVQQNGDLLFMSGLLFTASLLLSFRIWLDPDRVRASQSNAMLSLASGTFASINDNGIGEVSADEICKLMLPATSASAVALTDTTTILGYAGVGKELYEAGTPLRTAATREVLRKGETCVIRQPEDVGLPAEVGMRAAIIAPLLEGSEVMGTVKFYYRSARNLTETEESIANGFAELLSAQVSAYALDGQRKQATSMELKVLQSQINPHFLFNTLNTISALIRTDPTRAREMLREFASFYRHTLENSSDLITIAQEIDQTQRYFGFEVARFGEDRLRFDVHVDASLENALVPAFMIQPLVENAVRHAMPPEGLLEITCTVLRQGRDITIAIDDNGIGMDEQTAASLNGSSEGLGMALQNIRDRIAGHYGPDSYLDVESKPGAGTCVTLYLKGAIASE